VSRAQLIHCRHSQLAIKVSDTAPTEIGELGIGQQSVGHNRTITGTDVSKHNVWNETMVGVMAAILLARYF
jgi:hypothetical protein